MNTDRDCGCKSFRSCILCEAQFDLVRKDDWGKQLKLQNRHFFEYSIGTQHCFSVNDSNEILRFPGIHIICDFVSQEEEDSLIRGLDLLPWDASQSGRRKQNFGPRANFKKRKAKNGSFKGFPKCTKFIQDRFQTVPLLESYHTVEQCSIEYRTETGAAIEPHIDDCWIWGERIVQLNLLSPSFLTCTPYSGQKTKYNLHDVHSYPKIINNDEVVFNPFLGRNSTVPFEFDNSDKDDNIAVKIPLPPRSLLIMYGSARYEWEHSILREDICGRRIVIAYRELTPPYLPGGQEFGVGKEILGNSKIFW